MLSPNKVSIVCPNFNKGKFVAETIASVQNNTYSNWELIIVDDGSTDDSLHIIESFATKDNRIILIQQSNQGGAAARNKGMAHATGEYLLFLDSDDLISASCLEQRVEQAKIDSDGMGWVFPLLPFEGDYQDNRFMDPWIPPRGNFLERLIEHDITWTSMSPLWRTRALVPHFTWNPGYPRLQDIEFHTHILLQGGKIYTYPEGVPDCFYRLDEQKLVLGSRYQYLEKWVKGCHLYIHEFWPKLPKSLAPKLSRTTMAFLSVAAHYYRQKQITQPQFQALVHLAALSTPIGHHQKKLKWYGQLIQILPFHLPGLNAFFKFWIH